jgi:hypothetical protein
MPVLIKGRVEFRLPYAARHFGLTADEVASRLLGAWIEAACDFGHGRWTIEIVKRSDTAKGFVVLPRRWGVERTFAWLNRCRRLAKDWERSIASSTAFAHIASIRMLTRRIARYSICT